MKTNGSPRTARKFSTRTRLIIAITTFSLLVMLLGINAFMQTSKSINALVSANERASASVGVTPDRPLVVGTCDTAGAIEVESSGGTAAGVPTPYATLGAAFTAINGGTLHTGTITIDVCGNTNELTATATLNASGAGSTSYTSITMSPAGGAARTITGATTAGNPLIDFSGADNVTIDGLNTGGNSLTISNTTAGAGSSTIRFINDATSNTIQNCTISGSGISTTGGTIFFSTTTGTTGNDGNIINNNNIGPAGANLPFNGIYASGTTTTTALNNSGVQITNNKIFDFFAPAAVDAGILVSSGNTDWTITGNSLYQTATRTMTTAANDVGIQINNTSGNNFVISNNFIGGSTTSAGGTAWTIAGAIANRFRGISLNVGSTTATSVQGNTIANFAYTSNSSATTVGGAWVGIYLGAGNANIGSTTGNTIGSGTGTGSIAITMVTNSGGISYGIYSDATSTVSNISNNVIGSMSQTSATIGGGITGIATTLGTTLTINGNTIGSTTTANSITTGAYTGVTTEVVTGINNSSSATISITTNTIANLNNGYLPAAANSSALLRGILSTSGVNTITGNTVRNLTTAANATGTGASAVVGIIQTGSTAGQTISQNTIHSISETHATAAANIYGIYLSNSSNSATTNIIERNFIHSLSSPSTGAAVIMGIYTFNGGATYRNNMIRLGIDAAGSSLTSASLIINGIQSDTLTTATNNWYFNSIFIGGTGVATGSATTSVFKRLTSDTMDFRDNIAVNNRSNSTGTGKHYLMNMNASTTFTSNYNVFNQTGTGAVFGVVVATDSTTFANWKTNTSQDANSFFSDPIFIAPTGTSATVDLHINPSVTTVVEANGILISPPTNDFDGQTRSTLTPVDIGADAGNFMGVDLTPPTITYTALGNTTSTSNRTLTISVTDVSGVPTSGTGLPRLYFRKGTSGTYSTTQCSFTSGSSYSCTFDYSLVTGGSVIAGDTVQYYVVAQDAAATPNVTSNPSAGASGFTANPPAASTPPTTPNSYSIATAITGTKTVCASGCDYTTLTGATGIFKAINTNVVTGNVEIQINGDLSVEDGANGLNALAEEPSGSNFTVKIYPTGVPPRSITGSFAGALVRLNGASRVTIDGSIGGTGTDRSLTIQNTSITTPSVVLLGSTGTTTITNDALKNCIIRNGVNTSSAVVISDAGTLGNAGFFSNITIQNNDIQKAFVGVFATGGTTPQNGSNLTYTQNTLSTSGANAIRNVGLYMQGVNGATVSQNTISNLSSADVENDVGIWLATGTINATVSGNTVSTLGYTGLSTNANAPIGINVTSGTTSTNVNVTGNNVSDITSGGTTAVRGIVVAGSTSDLTIQKNNVQGVVNTNTSTYGAYGMDISGGNNIVVKNNFVSNVNHNMSGGLAFDTTFGVVGIRVGAGTGIQVYDNSVNLYGPHTGTAATSLLSAAFALVNTTSTGCDVRDNIFANTITGGTTSIAHVSVFLPSGGTSAMNLTWNNNAYFNGTDAARQGLAQVGTAAGTGFYLTSNFNPAATTPSTNFRSYSSTLSAATTNDNASLASTSAAPFTTTNDLHIKRTAPATPAIVENVGASIGSVTDDYDGDTRVATPDIGADEVMTVAYSAATYSAGEGDGTKTITVTRTSGAGAAATVNYTTADGSATGGANCSTTGVDYVTASGTLNFAAGDTSKTFNITICDDSTFETGETVNLSLSTVTGDAILGSPDTAVLTINDNDSAPTFSVNDVTHMEGNMGTTAYVFTITKTGNTAFNATVSYETVDGTATSPSDFTAIPTTPLTFLPAETSMQVTVFVNGDTTFESPDETFTVHLSGAVNATIADADGTGTIENDDTANTNPTISDIADQSVSQDNSVTASFTVGDAETPAASLTLTGMSSDQTLVPDANITFGGMGANRTVTVTPAAGQTGMATITVTVHDASNATASDSFVLTVNPVTCYAPPANMVSWYSAEGNATDIQGTNDGTFLNGPSYIAGKVGQAFALNGANQGIPIGNPQSLQLTSAITIDAWVNPSISLTDGFLSAIVTKWTQNPSSNSYALYLARNGSSVQLYGAINTNGGNEHDLQGGSIPFNSWSHVALTYDANASSYVIYVNGQIVNSSSNFNSNLVASNANVAIGFEDSGQPRYFAGFIDEVEIFNRALTATEIAGIYNASSAGKCHTSTLQFSSSTYDVNENGTPATITVTRTGAHDSAASVHYMTADGSATGGASCGLNVDYQTTMGTLNFMAGDVSKTFNVPVCDDLVFEGDETVNLSLDTATGTGVTLGSPNTAVLTIHDDEGLPTVSVNDVTFTGADSLVTSGFTVSLSHASVAPVTVNYATSDNTATAGEDYTAASGMLTFAPGETTKQVPITILADSRNEPEETFFIDLNTAIGATIGDGHGVGTIPNDDPLPVLSIDNQTVTEGNMGPTTATFTVTLTPASGQTVMVHYATADGSATTADNDYNSASGDLTFMPGQTTKTIDVTVNGDTTYEANEDFTVTLSSPVLATIGTGTGNGVINNDDAPPATLTVNTTDDMNFGFCLTSHCSLREAINAANANADLSTISFNIAGSGVHTISPTSALPSITAPVVIDGYTQPGASLNMLATGDDAVLKIELDGTNAGAGTMGLVLTGGGSTIKGLVINRFSSTAIHIQTNHLNAILGNFIGTNAAGDAASANAGNGVSIANSNGNQIGSTDVADRNILSGNSTGVDIAGAGAINNTVKGNLIGTDKTGTVGLGNGIRGVSVQAGATNNTIGGSATGARNVISDNDNTGVYLANVNNNFIQGNFIGTKSDGIGALNNGVRGIWIFDGTDNHIGGSGAGEGNTIGFNGGNGVEVKTGTQNAILGNSIFANDGLGIDLNSDGVTLNDMDDGDTGPNDLQNFPVISSATVTGSTKTITGSLNSSSNTQYRLEFFASSSCNAPPTSDYGEGQTLIHAMNVTTVGNDVSFTFHPTTLTTGQFITATATDPAGNTSEFSQCVAVNNGTAGIIEFTSATYMAGEGDGMAHVTVKRTGGSQGSISATFNTSNGTATAGSDYTAVNNYTVTFADGDTANQTIDIPITDDMTYEGNETVNLSLGNTTINRPDGGIVAAVLTITENDAQPTLSVNDFTFTGADSITHSANGFTVTLTGATSLPVMVHYATSDHTALAGEDYTAASGTLTFAPGETTKDIPITILGDTRNEPTEDFFVDLDTPVGATISDGHGIGTIPNDDALPTVSVNDFTFTGADSLVVNGFSVTLSAASGQTVTVHYATSDDTAIAGEDYTATSGTLTFNPGDTLKTVPVTILADTVREPEESFFIDLDNPMNATLGDAHGIGTIPNDDPIPSITINDVSKVERDAGNSNATFTVTLSNPSSTAVTLNFATADGTATAGVTGDYTATGGPLTFNPGQVTRTFTVPVRGDVIDEANETFSVTLSGASGGNITDGTSVCTIIDDDINTGDFDGDGKNDLVVFRPNADELHIPKWYILNSADGSYMDQQFGLETDLPVAGDYDGDGKKEIAVFRSSTGTWYISHGSAQDFASVQWGLDGDKPVEGDYDGDGKTDIAVFRPSDGIWYIRNSDGTLNGQQWGLSTDKPVPADYDGDGKTDLAVFRKDDPVAGSGMWYILRSSDHGFSAVQWGVNDDKLVPADYDLDGKADIAVWRPSDGIFYVLRSSDGSFTATQWGLSTDVPVVGDYDGDGKADISVWRASDSHFYILHSSDGTFTNPIWGLDGDIPIAARYVPEQ